MGGTPTPAVWFKRRSRPHHDDARTLLLPTPPSILGVHRWRRHKVLNDRCRCAAHCWIRRNVLYDGRRSNGKHRGSWCDVDSRKLT